MREAVAHGELSPRRIRSESLAFTSREPNIPHEGGAKRTFEIQDIFQQTSSGTVKLAKNNPRRAEADRLAREAVAAGDADIAAGRGVDRNGVAHFVGVMFVTFTIAGAVFIALVKYIPLLVVP